MLGVGAVKGRPRTHLKVSKDGLSGILGFWRPIVMEDFVCDSEDAAYKVVDGVVALLEVDGRVWEGVPALFDSMKRCVPSAKTNSEGGWQRRGLGWVELGMMCLVSRTAAMSGGRTADPRGAGRE